MAIQPIDLQTLYTQLEKVSKNVAFQQQGMQLKNAVNQADHSRQILEKNKSVQKMSEENNEANKVGEREAGSSEQSSGKKDNTSSKETTETDINLDQMNCVVIKDPSLGKYIDVTG